MPNSSAANRNVTDDSNEATDCTMQNEPKKIVTLVLAYVLSYTLHQLMKPLSQPPVISDIIVGMFLGNLKTLRQSFDPQFLTTINFIAEFGMMCYLFVLALEMDPYVIMKPPTRDAMMAYAGMASSFIIACSITSFLRYFNQWNIGFTLALSIIISGTGSHILTRLTTNLKIGKSDIGKLVHDAGVHTDMISILLICIGYLFFPPSFDVNDIHETFIRLSKFLTMGCALWLQTVFTAYVSPIFLNWINSENPVGRPMEGSHLVISIAFMVMVCCASPLYGYSAMLSAFMAGLFLPSKGRMSKWAVGKINYLLNTVFYPLLLFWIGYAANISELELGDWGVWGRFFVLAIITLFGKVIGTVLCGALLGFHWRESADIGLLLSAKGHFHLFLATTLSVNHVTNPAISFFVIIVIFLTIAQTPSIVRQIIKRARTRAPTHERKLQFLNTSNELRVLLGLHGLHNVHSSINFMEISTGTPDPGIIVYATDMIELTEQIAATLVHQEGMDTVTVTDQDVTNMREEITGKLQSYVEEKGRGITLRRMLALSTFNNMAQDICILAEDLKVCLLILPFHKIRLEDGTLDGLQPALRYVNRKVLRNAPCSVGILVDREFGLARDISTSVGSFQVAIIFIGGKDDREALAYGGWVAQHRGVKLTVIRFLLDDNADNEASRRVSNSWVSAAAQEAEMKLDDECFAEFYDRHIAVGHVAYREKHLANSAETYSTLRSLEGQYKLIIVGRGMRLNAILTAGLNDWQQCPELGPVGDVLSGSDFSPTTSILIIQQHCFKGDLDGLDDEFCLL